MPFVKNTPESAANQVSESKFQLQISDIKLQFRSVVKRT